MEMPPTIFLIDGHALAYRTYFAITAGGGRFSTTAGEPTAGIFGFASVLIRLLEQEKPEYLAVAFDTGKTFRNQLFKEYKTTRAKMPEDLRPQIERIRQMIDAFDVQRIELEGFEADDVLGSIAHQAVAAGLGVKIITGDKDLLQLVNDRIIVSLPGSKLSESKDYTEPDVKELLGVTPAQVVDYKALVGDHSDNIPGVPGVGEKTATSLLTQYPTLDEIYTHLNDITPRIKTKLEEGKESAYLSRDLATIRTNLPVSLDLEKASTKILDFPAVEKFFQQMEFRSLLSRLHNLQNQGIGTSGQQLSLFGHEIHRVGENAPHKMDVIIVNSEEQLAALKQKLDSSQEIALDTETTSVSAMKADLVGISISVKEGEGYYIPVGHFTGETQLSIEKVISELKGIFKNPEKKIIGHNLKFDAIMLARNGCMPVNLYFDTMIAEWLLHPDSHNLGLKDLAETYLGVNMTHIEELIGSGKSQINMSKVPVQKAADYAAADAEITFELKKLFATKLSETKAQKILHEVEMPLIPVLAGMEMAGISLDVEFLKQMSAELLKRLVEIEDEVQKAVGYPFNLNSTQQLSKVLFETLKLEPPNRGKKTASGHYSTSAEVLEELRGKHPIVDRILENRELAKLRSTYLEALPLAINPVTHRVHTSFNQTGAVTGRLASSEPNLQNIPIRTELGSQIRKAFIAQPGSFLLAVDYSQIELRIVAHMSGDEAMLEAFRAGQDIHATTAAAIYNENLDEVTKEQRRHAKAINFGLIYGMSAFGLTRTTDLTLAEAENFVKEYFMDFPGVKRYLDGIRKIATQQGYVETLRGRRRYFPNLKSGSNPALRAREEREAINAPIQGTAADILKIAMVRLPAALQKAGVHSKLLLQVHDELVLECPQAELVETAKVVQNVMESAFPLSIPLLTDARWGSNWGTMKPMAEFETKK
jgi:DNA polymerase-1